MIPLAPVLRVVLALPQCFGEPRDEPRLAVIAEAVATVSETRSEAAALITIAEFESALCGSVHSGRKRGWAGIGLWQLEPASHRHPPFAGTDLASTVHAAGEALWLWRHARPGRELAERFRAYGGQAPTWSGGEKRAWRYAIIYKRLSISG